MRRSAPIDGEQPIHEGLPGEGVSQTAEIPASDALHAEPLPEHAAEAAATDSAPMTAEIDAREEAREAYESPAGDLDSDAAPAADAGEPHSEHAESGDIHAAEAADEHHDESPAAENGDAAPVADAANGDEPAEEEAVEFVGGADALEEAQERAPRFRRQYKIQEVIKRRQVMLVQVVKEERGSKGAALTTYLSLAGRYSVLMPNTARGGGISRKITSGEDRNRLKEIAQELEVPEGMGVILRTAGASRTKAEVKRDFEYLLRLWETVRDLTLQSTAPKLVYEEGSLTKRSIRDLYNKDIDEIVVAGDAAYRDAKEFMRMLMPSHAKHVKLYKDSQPVFTRYGVESQLDAMFSPTVQLRSGGYIVINQAEALVAIDVNSGRATREHHIEDTALKTNSEAADEVARQLRLRDLAGLIVIDFIDMDETRNNRTVERRLKEALRHDRARIQVGRISHFGLMEMSRQRIRTSVLESSTEKCPLCGGSGHVRSVSSVALQLLRGIEEMLIKGATHNLLVRTRAEVALYVLNHKRAHLRALEERFRITITVSADPAVTGQQSFVIDRGEQVHTPEAAKAIAAMQPEVTAPVEEEEEDIVEDEDLEAENEAEDSHDAEPAPMMHAEIETEAKPKPSSRTPMATATVIGMRLANGKAARRRRRRGRGRGRGGEPRDPASFTRDSAPGTQASRTKTTTVTQTPMARPQTITRWALRCHLSRRRDPSSTKARGAGGAAAAADAATGKVATKAATAMHRLPAMRMAAMARRSRSRQHAVEDFDRSPAPHARAATAPHPGIRERGAAKALDHPRGRAGRHGFAARAGQCRRQRQSSPAPPAKRAARQNAAGGPSACWATSDQLHGSNDHAANICARRSIAAAAVGDTRLGDHHEAENGHVQVRRRQSEAHRRQALEIPEKLHGQSQRQTRLSPGGRDGSAEGRRRRSGRPIGAPSKRQAP